MSTAQNMVGSDIARISGATDMNGQEGLPFVIQADGQYETSSANSAADCFLLSVDTEGADGEGLAYFGAGRVKVRLGATTNEGAFLTVAADARLDPTTTAAHIVVARALQAGVDGDYIWAKSMLPGVEYASLDGA